MRFAEPVADGIKNLDEHWDGGGKPLGLRGTAIPIYSRIALMAQVIDVFHVANGPEAALREARNRSGTWFDPHLVAAFERYRGAACVLGYASHRRRARGGLAPTAGAGERADRRGLSRRHRGRLRPGGRFAKVRYTSGHSERVTLFTDMIAEQLEFGAEQRRWLKRAHCCTTLVSSASATPSSTSRASWTTPNGRSCACTPRIREAILSRIGAFSELAPIAGAHHERLDGRGYPRGLRKTGSAWRPKSLPADIFDALTAERPYRAAMPITKALKIKSEMVGTQIDTDCFAALTRALGRIDETLAA